MGTIYKTKSDNSRYKQLRRDAGLSQVEVAQYFLISQTAVSKWERGETLPDQKLLPKLAELYNTTTDYLLYRDNAHSTRGEDIYEKIGAMELMELDDRYIVPLLGNVIAGRPAFSEENFEGYIYTSFKPPEEYFALRVSGDSMIGAGITPGSILIVHRQNTAENGQIVVALLGNDVTVKRLKIAQDGSYILMPENNVFEPIILTKSMDAQILGVVKEVRTKV